MSASQTIHPAAVGMARRAAGPFAVGMPEITKPFLDEPQENLPSWLRSDPNLPPNFDTQTDTRMRGGQNGLFSLYSQATSRAPTFIPPNAKRVLPDYPSNYETGTPHAKLLSALRENPFGSHTEVGPKMTPEEVATGEPAVRAFDEIIPWQGRDDWVRGNERAQAFRDSIAEHRQMMNQ